MATYIVKGSAPEARIEVYFLLCNSSVDDKDTVGDTSTHPRLLKHRKCMRLKAQTPTGEGADLCHRTE